MTEPAVITKVALAQWIVIARFLLVSSHRSRLLFIRCRLLFFRLLFVISENVVWLLGLTLFLRDDTLAETRIRNVLLDSAIETKTLARL